MIDLKSCFVVIEM